MKYQALQVVTPGDYPCLWDLVSLICLQHAFYLPFASSSIQVTVHVPCYPYSTTLLSDTVEHFPSLMFISVYFLYSPEISAFNSIFKLSFFHCTYFCLFWGNMLTSRLKVRGLKLGWINRFKEAWTWKFRRMKKISSKFSVSVFVYSKLWKLYHPQTSTAFYFYSSTIMIKLI